MKLTKVIIKNFQSHEYTIFDLTVGVNIIGGSSDSGKSALIRALGWVFHNKPTGDAFMSTWGDGETFVAVYTDNGNEVIRRRSSSGNVYELNGSTFSALSGKVPEEIQKILNVGNVNFQFQMDSPFLLSLTPGKVAQHFNQVANLDKIDNTIANNQKTIRQKEQELKAEYDNLKRYKENFKEYKFVPQFERKVNELEELKEKVDNLSSQIQMLNSYVEQLQEIENTIQEKSQRVEAKKEVQQAAEVRQKVSEIEDKRSKLADLIESYDNTNNRLRVAGEKLKAKELLNNALQTYKQMENISGEYKKLEGLIDRFSSIEGSLSYQQEQYERLHRKFDEKFPDVCPLCGNEVNDLKV